MMDHALLVLMWKFSRVRIRRFIHTTVELVSPIAFLILLFSVKDLINPKSSLIEEFNLSKIDYTEPYPLMNMRHAPLMICYYPDTKLTRLIMDSVGKKFGRNQSTFSIDNHKAGVYALPNDSLIPNLEFTPRDAVVLFENMEGEDLPNKLRYTIRMKDDFLRTDGSYFDDMILSHSGYGTQYDTFMMLQWAVDSSYIYLLTKQEIPQTVSAQEFPFYSKMENNFMETLGTILCYVCGFSLLLSFVFLVCRLLEEKATGVQELIKMVGVSSNTLGVAHFLNAVPAGLVYSVVGTVLLTCTWNPLIPHTNGIFIFIALALHYVTIVALAFACSHIVSSTQYIVSISVFCYIMLWSPTEIVFRHDIPRAAVIASGLLPHVPIYWFWKEVATVEQHGGGLTAASMLKYHDTHSGSVIASYLMMLVQSALFFFISWYLGHVRPGKYGQALPANFLFTKQFWTKNEIVPGTLLEADEEEHIVTDDNRYFERAPEHLEVGIKIDNVSKVFPKQRALSNVSLEIYKGEITVLLGHNGAGKTTLMSIITGMMSATTGKVYVDGMDTVTRQAEVRKHLGLCPQHNLFFPDLTVLEHVMFFTMLKGKSFASARESSNLLLKQLGIDGKAGSKSVELSGGMKRRLQLACALAGDADVLILDEPTSGLDVETRRELWDLLLSLRGSRTVVLSTHFMEEAEVLGDRVAALHHGALRCHATTMHLKKAIGTGYRLSFTTIGAPNEQAVTAVVTSHVPDATLKEKTLNSLSYNLPSVSSDKFPELFTELESKRSELGIDSIGVGISTLEEVFLKLCSDVDNSLTDDEIDGSHYARQFNQVQGIALYGRQTVVLLKRQVKYLMSKKISFLILQVFLPILLICVFTNAFNSTTESGPQLDAITLNMDLYENNLDRRVLFNIDADGASLRSVGETYNKVKFEQAADVANATLEIAMKDILEYSKYLVGIELNRTDAKILYTTTVRHAAPVALNMLSNLFASQYMAGADGATITTVNAPLAIQQMNIHRNNEPKAFAVGLLWVVFVVLIILSTNINAASLPCKERASGSRHIHVMSGCPPELHWLATALFHAAVCSVCLILPTLLIAGTLERDHTIDQPDFLGTLFIVLLLGSLAFFAIIYLVTFNFGESGTGIVLVGVILVFGVVMPVIQETKDALQVKGTGVMYYILLISRYVMPPHTMVSAARKSVHVASINAFCSFNRDKCPSISMNDNGFDAVACCAGKKPREYLTIDEYSPALSMMVLAIQFLVYMCGVVLFERGVFNKILDRVMNSFYDPAVRADRSDIIRAEAAYVAKAIDLPTNQIKDAMLVHDIHKNYPKIFSKSCNAVKGVSFSVKKGECFGLLGVNGAGKSTTFKMLTAEECTTRGQVFANGHRQNKQTGKYLRSLGYCPQFFGLDEFQTGNDNLTLLLTLRGLQAADVHEEAKNWIQVVGLEKYRNRAVSGYSGGCARRLAAAAALCSGAPLTLLDEPTAGVDVSARRRVWAALRRGLADDRAVIITSHSMDEMEALCSSIAIMSRGEIRALGSAAALRAEHASGHAVLIKVKHSGLKGDEPDSARSELDRFKGKLHQTFNCTLKDEHKTMLHYHINETMRYSDLFTQLEGLKSSFANLMEDYSVTETTLEEVFLSFAKEQHEGPATV